MVGKILFCIFGGASLLFVLFMVFVHIVMFVQSIKNIRMCRSCIRETKVSEGERALLNQIITDNINDSRICMMVLVGQLASFTIGYLIGHFIL